MGATSLASPLVGATALLALAAACAGPGVGGADSAGSADSLPTGPSSRAGSRSSNTTWTAIRIGGESNGYALATDGTLSWRGRAFSPPLPLRTADGTSRLAYQISPGSPSGRWALAQGRGSTFATVHLLDRERSTTRETPVTKYGIAPWVAWAPSGRYAVVSNRTEGTVLLYRIDVASGEARQIDFGPGVRSPLSAAPIESTLQWLNAEGDSFTIDARVACNTAVERCDDAPPAQTRRFRVDLRTLQGHPTAP